MAIRTFQFVFLPIISVLVNTKYEIQKESSCQLEQKVDAVCENVDDIRTAFVFSGDNVWIYDITKRNFLTVDRIENMFDQASGIIEAAWRSTTYNAYYLLKRDKVYSYKGSRHNLTNITSAADHLELIREKHKVATLGTPTCVATCCDESDRCSFILYNSENKMHTCDYSRTTNDLACHGEPLACHTRINIDLKKDKCEGLLVDPGLEDSGVQWRVLVADQEKLNYWEDEHLAYSISYVDLFDCPSRLTTMILLISFGGVVLVLLLATTLFLQSGLFRKKRSAPLSLTDAHSRLVAVSTLK